MNLAEYPAGSDFPACRHAKHLTLTSNNDIRPSPDALDSLSSLVCLASVRHLVINTQTSSLDWNGLAPLPALHSLDIAWSELRPYSFLPRVKALSLTSECVSWRDVQYLLHSLVPQLEHLQVNVTTSDECRKTPDVLLSPDIDNRLVSIKICICQTLSDQIKHDLEPMLLSPRWVRVQWRMDSWYLYIWK